ncbi:MAG: hypothetical protein WBY53_02720 [Acidobacteriaceae bacterium]
MTIQMRGIALLMIQVALVLTTAGKYEWERHTRPMVWVRAEPFAVSADKARTLNGEGRYGQVQFDVTACGLPTGKAENVRDYIYGSDFGKPNYTSHKALNLNVRLMVRNGVLTAVDAGELRSADVQQVSWDMRRPCAEARLVDIANVYLPKGVPIPYTVKPGATLWVLVTVPEQGPPRPVELAISDETGFHPLPNQ